VYFEIVSASGGYPVHIRGANREKIFTSEVYTSKASAENAIRVVKEGAAQAETQDES
jgi:uncharacterized protein YegP (UPF0339 family)